MKILVFTKRVPATQEEELRIVEDGKAVDLSKVPFKMNDWDNYAVEEAVRIVEKAGGGGNSDLHRRCRIGRGPEKGHCHGRTGRLPHGERQKCCTTRLREQRLPLTFSRRRASLRRHLHGCAGGGRPVCLGRRHSGGQAEHSLCVHGHRHRRLRERSCRCAEGTGGRTSGAGQGLLPCVLSIQSGINEPQIRLHHGRE